tara:strand:- start:1986 stop:2321 length:336 start_codon:yes stop_codon:yes gene_type:complete
MDFQVADGVVCASTWLGRRKGKVIIEIFWNEPWRLTDVGIEYLFIWWRGYIAARQSAGRRLLSLSATFGSSGMWFSVLREDEALALEQVKEVLADQCRPSVREWSDIYAHD